LQPVACGPGVPCVIYRQPEPVVHQKYVEKQVPKLFRYERYVEPPPLPKRPIPWAPPPLPPPAPPPPARRPRMRAPSPEPCCCCCCDDKEDTPALVPSYKSKKKKSREAGIDLSALRNVQCVCDDELAVLTAAVAAAMAAEQSDDDEDDDGSSIEVICPTGARPGDRIDVRVPDAAGGGIVKTVVPARTRPGEPFCVALALAPRSTRRPSRHR